MCELFVTAILELGNDASGFSSHCWPSSCIYILIILPKGFFYEFLFEIAKPAYYGGVQVRERKKYRERVFDYVRLISHMPVHNQSTETLCIYCIY